MSGASGSAGGEHATKYFARYAEPEAALAADVPSSYLAALVVPVCGESPSLLDGFQQALAQAPGRVLLVLVVNARNSASPLVHAENQRLLDHLTSHFPQRRAVTCSGVSTLGVLGQASNYDVLWLDRASVGARLPEREGVGTVRKLGGDLAVALWARGQIACPRIASSDADVTLPDNYFSSLVQDVPESVRSAAWLWPFTHHAGGDRGIDEATVLYEISLRYYVLGLAAAGSCYAYQSVGSTLCVDAPAYLSVRGFPKREAGEDFYLLDKLAKVGPLRRAQASPVRIRARPSDRVPFGTGRRTQEIAQEALAGEAFQLYAPAIFSALGAVLQAFDVFAESARIEVIDETLAARVPALREAARAVLEGQGVFAALLSAAEQAPTGPVLRRRIHTWFNALRTLRFVHGMRERSSPSMPWRDALGSASFVGDPFREGSDPEGMCRALALTEARLPPQIGPALL